MRSRAVTAISAVLLLAGWTLAEPVYEPGRRSMLRAHNCYPYHGLWGATGGGGWTERDNRRLRQLVDHAHALGYFIRFYAINGQSEVQRELSGHSGGYNTGSLRAAHLRWEAMLDAGVDFIATDQYEAFAAVREARRADE